MPRGSAPEDRIPVRQMRRHAVGLARCRKSVIAPASYLDDHSAAMLHIPDRRRGLSTAKYLGRIAREVPGQYADDVAHDLELAGASNKLSIDLSEPNLMIAVAFLLGVAPWPLWNFVLGISKNILGRLETEEE